MRAAPGALVFLSVLSAGSGSSPGLLNEEPATDVRAVVLVDRLDPDQWPQDRYRVRKATVARDVFHLSVSYSGGCAEHEFQFVASRRFLESEPPKVQTLLAHAGSSDPCDALVSEELRFDLTPLKDHYRRTSRRESGTLILLLQEMEIPFKF